MRSLIKIAEPLDLLLKLELNICSGLTQSVIITYRQVGLLKEYIVSVKTLNVWKNLRLFNWAPKSADIPTQQPNRGPHR